MPTPGQSPAEFSPLSLASTPDRRSQPRLSAEVLGLDVNATLSQGIFVRVLNVSNGGALVELDEYLRPGTKSALKVSRPGTGGEAPTRMVANGQIARCWVDRLAPLRYRAALVFSMPAAEMQARAGASETDLTMLLERPA